MTRARQTARLLAAACAVALAGCAHHPGPLYEWGNFPREQYDTLQGSGQTQAEQITAMEAQAQHIRADGAALPPGFRAHLGMLYLNAGDPARARQMWQAERAAFPESRPYMDQLLARLDGGAPAAAAAGAVTPGASAAAFAPAAAASGSAPVAAPASATSPNAAASAPSTNKVDPA